MNVWLSRVQCSPGPLASSLKRTQGRKGEKRFACSRYDFKSRHWPPREHGIGRIVRHIGCKPSSARHLVVWSDWVSIPDDDLIEPRHSTRDQRSIEGDADDLPLDLVTVDHRIWERSVPMVRCLGQSGICILAIPRHYQPDIGRP